MNLQICFMNETVSDTESPSSDSECPMTNPKQPKTSPKNTNSNSLYKQNNTPAPATRPATLNISQPLLQPIKEPMTETDFFARQARLQTEARMALAQAKEMARMQMEVSQIADLFVSCAWNWGNDLPNVCWSCARNIHWL